MKPVEHVIFWIFVTIPLIIIYFVAASFLISFKNNLKKDWLFRKIVVYLSIIPVINFITMFIILLGILFLSLIGEANDIIKEIKEEFKKQ